MDHTSVSAHVFKAFLTNCSTFICSWFRRETALLSCRVQNLVLPICGSASRVQQIEMVLIIRSLTWSWVHYPSSMPSCLSLTDHDFSSRNLPLIPRSTASDLSSQPIWRRYECLQFVPYVLQLHSTSLKALYDTLKITCYFCMDFCCVWECQ